MAVKKQLNNRQLALIDDLFAGELNERAVLDKYKVSRNVYNKWLNDKMFAEEFDRRIGSAHRQSELIIARYCSLAAAKLVELTESQSQETARKACLDIIAMPKDSAKKAEQSKQSQTAETKEVLPLSQQTASRILEVLAEQRRGGQAN